MNSRMFYLTSLGNLLNKCYDCFEVSLNFDPVKGILKIGCQIYI